MMRAAGGELALVLIPTREDVTAGYSKAAEPIVKFCKETGPSCLSLLDRFVKERAAGVRLSFDSDIHWTRVGPRSGAVEGAPAPPGPAAGLSARPDSTATPAATTRSSPSESAGSRR